MKFKDMKLNGVSRFTMQDYNSQVSGVVYEGNHVQKGMPLGGIGTGYVCLEGNGCLGKSTIFSDFNANSVKMPFYDVPFLFLVVNGRKIVLSTKTVSGWESVEQINYWGHFPIVDLDFAIPEPLNVSLTAFSPFIPGNENDSNIPAVMFELTLENRGLEVLDLQSSFAFPGIPANTWPQEKAVRYEQGLERVEKPVVYGTKQSYLYIQNHRFEFDYFAGVMPIDGLTTRHIPHPMESELQNHVMEGTSIGCETTLTLLPGETKQINYILTWFRPYSFTFDSHPHKNQYASRFGSSVDVAQYLIPRHSVLYGQTKRWQELIFRSHYPDWMQDLLINSLYSLTKNTFWFVNDKSDSWWGDKGLFTHSESFDGCCIQETMVCRMHGHFAALFLFPELEKTTLDAFQYYQLSGGEIPFAFGMGTAIESPIYRRQHPINTSEYVHMVYRYFLRTKDIKFLKTHYPSVKKGIEFMLSLDDDRDFLVNEHSHALPESKYPANQFYDIWPWYGTSAYVAGIWLAALNCAEAISEVLEIEEDRLRYRQIFNSGLKAYIEKLWNGAYLRLYNDELNHNIDETCLANQLMLEWCNHVTELPPILGSDIIQSSLQKIAAWNVQETPWGMINGYHPEGLIANNDHARMVFIGEVLCACMTFLYKGQPEIGLNCSEEIYSALLLHGHLWDQHCIIDGVNGSPVWGSNYYSNLAAWALPMAFDGKGIGSFSSGAFIAELLNYHG